MVELLAFNTVIRAIAVTHLAALIALAHTVIWMALVTRLAVTVAADVAFWVSKTCATPAAHTLPVLRPVTGLAVGVTF
jgi:hypothetical protein